MKKDLLFIFVVLSAIFFFISCGGSDDAAGGGTGGTGIFSAGQITAKGSLTVNDIKYETQGAQIFQDGTAVSDDSQLKVGMIVEIEGTVNGSSTGTASIVRFDDSVEGPIIAIDTLAKTLEVLGQPVLVDDRTVFDNSTIIPPDITGLNLNDIVEVSGQLDDLGNIRATHIEKKPAGAEVEVTGFVSGKSPNTFLINNLTVDFSIATLENFVGGEPEDGDFVEVKGLLANFNPATNTLVAASVENKTKDIDDGLEAEVEGFVETLTAGGFTVVATSGRVEVQVDAATVFSGGIAADLQVGMKVEAEGQVLGGVLLADKVSFEDNIRVEVAAAGADGSTLTIQLRRLPAVPVKVDDRTELKDNRSSPTPTNDPAVFLNSINVDDDLKIRGRVVGSEVLATELEVDDPSGDLNRVDLRGPVDAAPADTQFFEVLGVLIDTVVNPGVTFEDINENLIDRATFFGTLQAGTQVEVQGDLNPVGDRIDASELELED
ncbi:MAG: DUF5666 domain-containing protein [Planctomycetota bacterium]|jgi:hypothetical protein